MLQKKFRNTGEDVLTSINFQDFADGVGYSTLYGLCSASRTALINGSYALTKAGAYSDVLATSAPVATSSSWSKVLDLDFDAVINLPTRIRGKTLLNVPLKPVSSGANNTLDGFVWAYLKKVVNGVETVIVDASSAIVVHQLLSSVTTYNHERMVLVELNTPLTLFKKGEILRITLEGWGQRTGLGHTTTGLYIGHDPQNRLPNAVGPDIGFSSAHGDNTIMTIQLPIIIDR